MASASHKVRPGESRFADFRKHCYLAFVLLIAALCYSSIFFVESGDAQSMKSTGSKGSKTTVRSRVPKLSKKRVTRKTRDKHAAREENEPREDEADDPEARANWFWFQRMFPFNEIAPDARQRAWDSLPKRDKDAKVLAGTIWYPIGPAPTTDDFFNNTGFVSGRINSIAVSPANNQIVLIGSASGGIWRSTDGGASFTPVSDDQVDLAVATIAFAPGNPSIVYAGMGDPDHGYFGTGVLRSSDAGATWTKVSNGTLTKGLSIKILVDPADSNRVYLAQYNVVDVYTNVTFISGVYVSTDGGVNWNRTLNCLPRDLAMHPTNSQILYAGVQFRTGDQPGLYKSTDSGQTWTNVYASPYTSVQDATKDFKVATTPASPNRVYIYYGTRTTTPFEVRLEMSDDAGQTFTSRGVISANQIDAGQFGYNTYLVASPTSADTVYVGARDMFRSTNGGLTFTNLTNSWAPPYTSNIYQPSKQKVHSDHQAFAFEPGSGSTFYAGSDGGLWKTTNSGSTFTSLNASLSLTQFVALSLHPTDATRTYGGAQDTGTQRREAGTSNWTDFSGGDGGQIVINVLNPAMVFDSYIRGRIYRDLNNTQTFSGTIADPDSFGESLTSPRILAYPPIVGNGVDARLYVGTWRLFICSDCDNTSKLYHTGNPPNWFAPGGFTDLTNGGSDVLSTIAVARSNTNIIYTGSRGGRVMMSTNGGADWNNITSSPLPTRSITNITVSPTNANLVYLTVSGYGSGHVFRSTNGGANWTDISNNLPNIPTSAFLIDPLDASVLYAGTDIGVFRSTDSGATWTVFNNNLPPVPVIAFAAQASGLIQIATYGRGAYELPNDPNPEPSPSPSPTSTFQFSATNYNIQEDCTFVTITVSRPDNTSGSATVDYATSDVTASERKDYNRALGTLQFGPGETSKTFVVLINEDSFGEGNETFNVTLSNPTGGTVGTATATVNINDDSSEPATNAIDDPQNFVCQQYHDFLNRQPDASGLAFWTGGITACGSNQACIDTSRINISAAFFLSIEFQQTGYLVERIYKVAYANAIGVSTIPSAHGLPVPIIRLNEFLADAKRIGDGVVVLQAGWEKALENNKQAFASEFVARSRFTTALPTALTPAQFVDALSGNAGNVLSASERQTAINLFGGAGNTINMTARAQAVRQVAEDQDFFNSESNRAFVLMQYFGYLRRNPNDTPDSDYTGYDFWLQKLILFNGNYIDAEMVRAFISSIEYRQRFGQ